MRRSEAKQLAGMYACPEAAELLILRTQDPGKLTAYRALQALRWLDSDNTLPIHARVAESVDERIGLAIALTFVKAVRAGTVKSRVRCMEIVQAAINEARGEWTQDQSPDSSRSLTRTRAQGAAKKTATGAVRGTR